MRSIRIKNTALTNISNLKFILRARIIRQSLINHGDVFIDPPVDIETMGDAIDDLNKKYLKGRDGSRLAKSARNIQKVIVLNMLQQTGTYVMGVANTKNTFQEKKMLVEMAGYAVSKGPDSRVGAIMPAHALRVSTTGMPGSGRVDLRWKRGGKGAYSFSVLAAYYIKDEEPQWINLGISRNTKFTATGLKHGIWLFRVIAHGTAGPSAPSQMVSIAVG